eukprot:1691775-Prymnesium_polylepis.1
MHRMGRLPMPRVPAGCLPRWVGPPSDDRATRGDGPLAPEHRQRPTNRRRGRRAVRSQASSGTATRRHERRRSGVR